MNKAEFIDAVAAKAGLSKKDAKGAVDAVLDTWKNKRVKKINPFSYLVVQ